MIRLILAMCGLMVAFIGHDAHQPVALLLGLASCVPVAVRFFALPNAKALFFGSAVVVGFALAVVSAGHHASVHHVPVAAASCVVATR